MLEGITSTVLFVAGPEILILVGILVLLFGASKIPKLARNMGKGITEFQKAREEDPEVEAAAETEDEVEAEAKAK